MTKIHYSFLSRGNGSSQREKKGHGKKRPTTEEATKITCQQKGHKVVRYIISMGRGRHTHTRRGNS
jgi:hypothetical protein